MAPKSLQTGEAHPSDDQAVYYFPIASKFTLQKKTKKNTDADFNQAPAKKHLIATGRAMTTHEAHSANKTLTALGSLSEISAKDTLSKDVLKEVEKTEDVFLKGLFQEILTELFNSRKAKAQGASGKRKLQKNQSIMSDDDDGDEGVMEDEEDSLGAAPVRPSSSGRPQIDKEVEMEDQSVERGAADQESENDLF